MPVIGRALLLAIALIQLSPVSMAASAPEGGTTYLSCDLNWTTGQAAPFHLDLVVNFATNKVGSRDAQIDSEQIVFRTDSPPITTRINRRSGSISFYTERLGRAEGSCEPVRGAKF